MTTKEALEPCPKCRDCWALYRSGKDDEEVTCGRCGFNAPYTTWQSRHPIPARYLSELGDSRAPAPIVAPEVDERIIEIVAATAQSSLWNANGYHQALADTLERLRSLRHGSSVADTVEDGLRNLLESYTEPCAGDCDHSQCPLLRELYALRMKATLERARVTVKPIVDREKRGEEIGDLMHIQLRAPASTVAPQQSDAKWDKSGLKEACQRGLAMGRHRQEFDLQLLLDILLEIERLEAAVTETHG